MRIMDIIFNPIIPVPVMLIFCVVLLVFKRRGVTPYIRQIIAVILLFIVNLRPMYPSDNITVKTSKLDLKVVVVIDDTISMLGDDQPGYDTRIDKVREDVRYIVENLPGAKFSIIAFNNNVHVLTPFTDSVPYIYNALDSIYPLSPTYATGTNISSCVGTLEDVLDDANSEEEASQEVVLFFLSDGENTDNNRMRSFTRLADYLSGGAVMGYGTERGGHMSYYSQLQGTNVTVMDGGAEAVTRINEDNLESIALDMDIQYINMSGNSGLESVVQGIQEMHEAEPEDDTRQGYVDIYYFFMVPLAILVAYEFISLKRRG